MESTAMKQVPAGDSSAKKPGRAMLLAGWILSVAPAAFLLIGGVMYLAKPAQVVEGAAAMGYPRDILTGLGIVLLASVALYLIPQTSLFGAVLLTGYLGGAVATHVRVGDPLLTRGLIPVYFCSILWIGLCLRDRRVRAAISLTSPR